MVCLYCGHETTVTNSRHQKRLNQTWRRRRCVGCSTVFTTLETPDLSASLVVRKIDTTEHFSRDKLFLSLVASLGHRRDSTADAGALSATIITLLLKNHSGALLEAREIAQTTQTVLTRFDKAAATHYTAYHSENL